MLQIYADYKPVGWREMTQGGFAKGILAGKEWRTEGEDERVGTVVDFEGKMVIVGIRKIAGNEYFCLSDGERYEHVIAEF